MPSTNPFIPILPPYLMIAEVTTRTPRIPKREDWSYNVFAAHAIHTSILYSLAAIERQEGHMLLQRAMNLMLYLVLGTWKTTPRHAGSQLAP